MSPNVEVSGLRGFSRRSARLPGWALCALLSGRTHVNEVDDVATASTTNDKAIFSKRRDDFTQAMNLDAVAGDEVQLLF